MSRRSRGDEGDEIVVVVVVVVGLSVRRPVDAVAGIASWSYYFVSVVVIVDGISPRDESYAGRGRYRHGHHDDDNCRGKYRRVVVFVFFECDDDSGGPSRGDARRDVRHRAGWILVADNLP